MKDSPLGDGSIVFGAGELLDRVKPLWQELRKHHAELVPFWREELLAATFEERKEGLLRKAVNGLAVSLVTADGNDVGYCVCTVNTNRQGEIDSLYVDEAHRRRGFGGALMSEAMRWLGSRQPSEIVVDVLSGNEAAIQLYERLGFHARTVRLRYVLDASAPPP